MKREIIQFSTGCPKCTVLKKKQQAKNIPYILNESIQEMMALGFKSAPLLSVNGQVMDFTAANTWINQQQGG